MGKVRATIYSHTQSSASSTWTIEHNLSGNGSAGYPIVDVVVDYNGAKTKMIPYQVTVTDKNTVTVSFSEPFTGSATVLV